VVIAVSRLDVAPQPDIAAYYDFCLNRKETHPIVTADVRRREDILMVLDLLFTQLELEYPRASPSTGRDFPRKVVDS
jgi:hypothetical protein